MPNLFLFLAGVSGFLGVGIGAFGAHALKDKLTPELAATFQTGVQYHLIHTLALFGVGLLVLLMPQASLARTSGWLFTVGIVLFSGSLYTLALSGVRWLGAITPLGGLCFLAAWGILAWLALSTPLQQ
ncbi:MAG: DUF423 domain-containing protein [Gammaproteobacteria bacterium]|jgi:uncharacterized membrane protein YgdD (TMEM256/DUF423 family)|nr:DUF423 domain-containing protein [Gammaproteobacteria bacterium]